MWWDMFPAAWLGAPVIIIISSGRGRSYSNAWDESLTPAALAPVASVGAHCFVLLAFPAAPVLLVFSSLASFVASS